jgi:hypothetical protein
VPSKPYERLGRDFFEFRDQQTRMAFFRGTELSNYLNTLSVRFHDYFTVVQLVNTFEEKHPIFGIPNTQEVKNDYMTSLDCGKSSLHGRKDQAAHREI